MKQTLQKSFLALLAVVFLFGCSHQDAVLDAPVPGQEKISLVYGDAKAHLASAFSEPLSKGQVFSNGAFAWADGDYISLWYNNNQYIDCQVDAGAGTIAKPEVSAQRTNYAIYPSASAPAAASAYSGTTPYVVYPNAYETDATYTDSRMPLIAKNTEGDSRLVFYHVGGLLRLKMNGVPSNTKSVEVEFEKSTITGTFAVTDPEGTEPKANTLVNGTGGKKVVFTFSGNSQVISYLNIPLPVGVYERETITITLYDSDNQIIAADQSNQSFISTIELGDITRRAGRLYGVYLFGMKEAVSKVSIGCSSPENFLNTSVTPHIGTLYLYEAPYEAQLTANVYYTNMNEPVSDNSLVNWSTSDASKVRVSPTGRITAVGLTDDAGVTITATSVDDASVSASVTIRVLAYSPVSNFTPTPFSVAADRTVEFSPGNLQATIKTDNSSENAEWQFAQYQYDYIGAHEGSSINTTVGSTIDLFCWSGAESSIDHYGIVWNGNVNHLEFVDWGNNKIDYRGSSYAAAFTYRTLTAAEWKYLLEERTGDKAGVVGVAENCRYSLVTVENVFGMIIYPDGFRWVPADMGPMPAKFNVYSPSGGSYSGANWAALENAGVVFLPAAGYRESDNRVYAAGTNGFYWSSTPGGLKSDNMNYIGYYPTKFSFSPTAYGFHKNYYNDFGAVRLVKINDGEKTNVRKVELDGVTNRQLQITTSSWPTSRTITSTVHYQNTSETVAVPIKIASGMIKDVTNECEDTPNSFTVSGNTLKATSYGYVVICSEDILNYNETYASDYCLVGATDGYYHLSNGKRVKLSPGNLQAKVDNNGNVEEWRFAPNPYDIIVSKGNYNYFVDGVNYDYFSNSYTISLEATQFNKIYLNTTSGWIDLFEYSQENSLNNKDNNYGVYIYRRDFSGSGDHQSLSFEDWGGCRITHGGTNYDPNTWRTPTDAEWQDLTFGTSLPNRVYFPFISNSGNLSYGHSLCNVEPGLVSKAMLLIPDGYIIPTSLTNDYGGILPITTSSWQTLKQAGCDLIPDMMNTPIPNCHLSESYELIDYYYEFLDKYGDPQEAYISYESYYYVFSWVRGDYGDTERALYWLTPALPGSYAEPWFSHYKTMTLNTEFNYNSRDNTRGPYYDETHVILATNRFYADGNTEGVYEDLGNPGYVRLIRVLE